MSRHLIFARDLVSITPLLIAIKQQDVQTVDELIRVMNAAANAYPVQKREAWKTLLHWEQTSNGQLDYSFDTRPLAQDPDGIVFHLVVTSDRTIVELISNILGKDRVHFTLLMNRNGDIRTDMKKNIQQSLTPEILFHYLAFVDGFIAEKINGGMRTICEHAANATVAAVLASAAHKHAQENLATLQKFKHGQKSSSKFTAALEQATENLKQAHALIERFPFPL
ncbi:MAG: hypothetical protein UU48_C0007G0021 [Candidatus Uhrbacteria bacterium GW2011_GWF2_41_16]|uniref:Uncharacterized protein n=2 Tax=Candidatus Uhriibacteriota TaxID=1752732 RepID=A0A0G0VA75_9BACT|nr:MAG: hypothetical protein UU35_C0005G0014 [Candidatus Uhrbacteria bacterium GW2011_GWC2_41_11]KKR97888.1 MAG: hypothetical protein UU48_C0007G0021 [Candidatus Uhrbacteria bacterium GW2011_GWF2_41_16]HBO99573.1 hypothetical protein [Candidatus Uhrbacteria bacterium]